MKAKLKTIVVEKMDGNYETYKLKLSLDYEELEMFRDLMQFAVRNAPKISQQHQANHVLTAINEKLKGF